MPALKYGLLCTLESSRRADINRFPKLSPSEREKHLWSSIQQRNQSQKEV